MKTNLTNYEKAKKYKNWLTSSSQPFSSIAEEMEGLEYRDFTFTSGSAHASAVVYRTEKGTWKDLDFHDWQGFNPNNWAPHRALEEFLNELNNN